MPSPSVAIIGAGFTGTMVAVQLARQTDLPVRVVLVERSERFAAGLAYSTPHARHLLNVPAGRMSAFADDGDHFLRWAQRRADDGEVNGGSFLPRRVYADYLRDVLASAGSRIEPLRAEAIAVDPDGPRWIVRFADGRSLSADAVVLAIGNFPPADPPCESAAFYASPERGQSPLYRRDPWAPGSLDVDADSDVLLLGTGLTMIDVAVALHAQGHRGCIYGLSRRGLLPQAHRDSPVAPHDRRPPHSLPHWPRTARGMLRELRREIDAQKAEGVDWRDIVTSLRRETPSLWMSLPSPERARFLRHLRPYWETHRHRVSPAIARTIQRMRDNGQLRIIAGRVLRYDPRESIVEATIIPRSSNSRRRSADSNSGSARAPEVSSIRVARVINCTGPDTDLSRVPDPLVQHLRTHGRIRPDMLRLGVDTDDFGCAFDRDGVAQPGLYVAGPLRRGSLWENVAVPELREEAARLARHLLRERERERQRQEPRRELTESELMMPADGAER